MSSVQDHSDLHLRETVLAEENLFEGRILTLKRLQVHCADGSEGTREVVVHHGGAAIVAVTEAGEILLVRQFRIATGEVLLELPAGKLELGEDPMDCALREIEEETGYRTTQVEPLLQLYVSPGYTSELLHIFLAENLHEGRQNFDEGEVLDLVKMPLDEALAAIRRGEIRDAKTVSGIMAYALRTKRD